MVLGYLKRWDGSKPKLWCKRRAAHSIGTHGGDRRILHGSNIVTLQYKKLLVYNKYETVSQGIARERDNYCAVER